MKHFFARLALRLHSFAYKLASKAALVAEGGLHPKHRLMNYHQFFLDHVSSTDRVLDIGCGNGALAYDLAQAAAKVTAIDVNADHEQTWRERYSRDNLTFHVGDATRWSPEEPFNVIVLSNVLEHIENRDVFLQSVKRLAPRLLIRVPMINRDWITLYKQELGLDYRLDTTHFIEYTMESFQSKLARAGLSIQSYSIQFGEIWAVVSSSHD